MTELKPIGPEKIVYQGKIFEIVQQQMKAGQKTVTFEIARRSPGVRLIIVKKDHLLLSREFRTDLNAYDYRLPGGKVFDTLDEYQGKSPEKMMDCAIKAAKKECCEETGLIAKKITHFVTTKAGATLSWDLYYFIIDEFAESADGKALETGEVIETEWKTWSEVKDLARRGQIMEDRTLGVLFKFFLQHQEL